MRGDFFCPETVPQFRYPRHSETAAPEATSPVSDPHPARHGEREDKRTFLQKLAEFIHPGPDSTDELIETLAEALLQLEGRVLEVEGEKAAALLSAGTVQAEIP